MHIVLLKWPQCIFEIHQLWQSGFSRVYSNCCCSCFFEPEIIKIDQSYQKMYNSTILNFQESTTILNAHTKKVWKLIVCTAYMRLILTFNLWLVYLQLQLNKRKKELLWKAGRTSFRAVIRIGLVKNIILV